MSEEQYNFVNGFRAILEHFHKHQIYVGGADGLFNKYLQPGELGCSACKSACMIQRYNELKDYEGKALIATNLALHIEQNLKNDSNL